MTIPNASEVPDVCNELDSLTISTQETPQDSQQDPQQQSEQESSDIADQIKLTEIFVGKKFNDDEYEEVKASIEKVKEKAKENVDVKQEFSATSFFDMMVKQINSSLNVTLNPNITPNVTPNMNSNVNTTPNEFNFLSDMLTKLGTLGNKIDTIIGTGAGNDKPKSEQMKELINCVTDELNLDKGEFMEKITEKINQVDDFFAEKGQDLNLKALLKE